MKKPGARSRTHKRKRVVIYIPDNLRSDLEILQDKKGFTSLSHYLFFVLNAHAEEQKNG